jgi:DNA repair protein RecO (recombination protein O)
MSTRYQLEPAYVLHSRPWSESSLILEVFSRDAGRVGLVARGARRNKSKWHGLLQPFQPLLLSWSSRGELGTLTGAERISNSASLEELALFCGFYVNELLMRLCIRDDPHPQLFNAYTHCLEQLRSGHRPQPALREFETNLLQEIGFELQLEREARQEVPVQPDKTYRYDPESGPVETAAGSAGTVLPGSVFLALANGDFSDRELSRGMRQLLQTIIAHHLGGRPLASQQILHALLSK